MVQNESKHYNAMVSPQNIRIRFLLFLLFDVIFFVLFCFCEINFDFFYPFSELSNLKKMYFSWKYIYQWKGETFF